MQREDLCAILVAYLLAAGAGCGGDILAGEHGDAGAGGQADAGSGVDVDAGSGGQADAGAGGQADAGPDSPCSPSGTQLLAEGQPFPMGIVADATSVYWANYGAGSLQPGVTEPAAVPEGAIMKVGRCGGVPIVLASSDRSTGAIALAGGFVFFGVRPAGPASTAAIWKVPIDGGAVETVVESIDTPGLLKAEGSRLYWAGSAIHVIDLAGGNAVDLTPDQPSLVGFDVEGGYAYWHSRGLVRRVAGTGGPVVTLAIPIGDDDPFGGVAAFGGHAYWTDGGCWYSAYCDTLRVVSGNGGPPLPLVTSLLVDSPLALAADASGLFVRASLPGTSNLLLHVGFDGSLIETWPSRAGRVALAEQDVYWTSDYGGTVHRAAKTVWGPPDAGPGLDTGAGPGLGGGPAPPGPTALWSRSFDGYEKTPTVALAVRPGAGSVVLASASTAPAGSQLPSVRVSEVGPDGGDVWTAAFGGATAWLSGSAGAGVSGIALDAQGRALIAWGESNIASWSVPMNHAGIQAIDPTGMLAGGWDPVNGTSGIGTANGVAANAAGEVAVTGRPGLSYATKLDASLVPLWSAPLTYAATGRGIAIDDLGNVYVTGTFYDTVDFGGIPLTGGGGNDVFLAKLDAGGSLLWAKRFGGGWDDEANALALDGAGHLFVTGAFTGAIDFGGGPLVSAGGADVYVVKLDADGHHVCSRRFGDLDAQQRGRALAVRPNGNVLVTGSFAGSVDFGGGTMQSLGGWYAGDVFLVELAPDCSYVASARYGDAHDQEGISLGVDDLGNAFLTGTFQGTVSFGASSVSAPPGETHVFLVKLAP